jgi:toxin ParE1/3/4
VRVVLHPDARAEIRAAALWYEERSPGWGDRFVGRVNDMLERLVEAPGLFAVWSGTEVAPIPIRKAVLEQFPYPVAFEAHSEFVLVLAVAHAKRQPLYWLVRMSQGPA